MVIPPIKGEPATEDIGIVRTPQRFGDYCLVSPARDEAGFIRKTLDSVLAQTVLPKRWIIVDDGSTDATAQIATDYAARYDWIQVHTHNDRGRRALGGGVVQVFESGLELLRGVTSEYVCKLDVDLILPPGYFERLLEEMHRDRRLGSVSGKPYFWSGGEGVGELKSELIADDVSVGASKFYRRTFLEDIGGLVKGLIWDGIDCYRGRMLGWRSRSIDEPELRFIHLRPMGSSDRGILHGRRRLGEGYWFMGAAPLFVLATAGYRLRHKPALFGSLATLAGYAQASFKGMPRYGDLEFRRFLRGYHRAVLMRGRARAVELYDTKTLELWNRRHEAPLSIT